MNRCLITGATGFLGRYLIDKLLSEGKDLTLLVRDVQSNAVKGLISSCEQKFDRPQINLVEFELTKEDLALPIDFSSKKFDHVYHLAAIYDLTTSKVDMLNTNVEGTRRLLFQLKKDGFKGRFHFVSSIAVAGDFSGRFDENMFDENQSHSHPYHLSKFLSEKVVREFGADNNFPIRIYRPSAIVGHSKTGQIDKLDGLYYLFLFISALKRWLPSKAPLIIPKSKVVLDVVPIDYVVDGLVRISQLEESELPEAQNCFHLSDPSTPSLSDVFKSILKVADGPTVSASIPIDSLSKFAFAKQFKMVRSLQAIHIVKKELLKSLGIPEVASEALMPQLQFEASNTLNLLAKYGEAPPKFEDYVTVLWDYYNKNLDPQKNRQQLAKKVFSGKRVLITGGSSGIGFASAKIAYTLGAKVLLVARDLEKLKQCEAEIKSLVNQGGDIEIFTCDLSDLSACDGLVQEIIERYGSVDILYSNAGRSIRRSFTKSQGRFHDLERTMQLNYFGAARLMMGLLPSMVAHGGGHIVHSSSMGTISATPRFGPYMASKIALDTLMDSMAAELVNKKIFFSSIKFPLVQTPMVSPTSEFKKSKLTSPEEAAMMFVDTVIDQDRIKLPATGKLLSIASFLSPKFITHLYNYGFQIWPDDPEDFPEMGFDRVLMKYFIPHSPL